MSKFTILEVISEALHLIADLLENGDERQAIHDIRDFRQQVQYKRDAVDRELKKKHGVPDED